MKVTDEMVDRFLNWPLPDSVCCDPCACMKNYPNSRIGTNLLTAVEARQMLEHVLQSAQASGWEQYKAEVSRIMKIAGFNELAIKTTDWEAWKESHFEEGETPAEGFMEEMSN
jgi:hypothetical protein